MVRGFRHDEWGSRHPLGRKRRVVLLPRVRRTAWPLLLLLTFLIGSVAQAHGQNGWPGLSLHAQNIDSTMDGVTVTGTLVSADTGDPIAGGHIFILNPGISPTDYAQDPSNPAAVFADGESDVNGRFQAVPPVIREQSYGVIVVARGYLGKVAENKQLAGPEVPSVVDLGEIRMQSAT
jgi:hypothetical protein